MCLVLSKVTEWSINCISQNFRCHVTQIKSYQEIKNEQGCEGQMNYVNYDEIDKNWSFSLV
jgi:hypothetical protein